MITTATFRGAVPHRLTEPLAARFGLNLITGRM